MNARRWEWMWRVVLLLAMGIFLWVGTLLPRETAAVFASPDETAVALFARGWSAADGFVLPAAHWGFGDFVGLHPRSMVQRGPVLVPVGFLGMPLLVMPFEKIWNGSGSFLTALLTLSSVWPLWQFARRLSVRAAVTAVVVYLSFPVVLLYANRGLFPNLPVVALGLWSVWLMGEKTRWKMIVGGFVLGLALTIRPLEAVWLLPWVVWAMWKRKQWWMGVVAAGVVPMLGYAASVHTYQSFVPTIGYWLRDVAVGSSMGDMTAAPVVQSVNALPFGIHPRTLQTNIRVFLLDMLWPWMLLAASGVVQLWWRDRIQWKSPVVLLSAWTAAALCLFYGQAVYADNIRGTAAIGNSFLRYLLPLVPLFALAIGAWVDAMARTRWRTVSVTAVIVALVVYGGWMGLARDEESVLATRTELQRYEVIRTEAARVLAPGTVVISERSDKLFAGLPGITAVSPMPNAALIRLMVEQNDVPVAWFHRTLIGKERAGAGFELTELLQNGNERLYLLAAPSP